MLTKLIHEASEHYHEIFDLLKRAEAVDKPSALVNNKTYGWEKDPASTLFVIFKEQRFANGVLALTYDDKDELIGFSGGYVSDFHPEIYVAGARTYILPSYRNKAVFANMLFPPQYRDLKERGCKSFIFSFNDHNKRIAERMTSTAKYEGGAVLRVGPNDDEETLLYGEPLLFFGQCTIKSTPQWVIYRNVDPGFDCAAELRKLI